MIDVENYKGAIAWLRRGLVELGLDANNRVAQLSVLQAFEVTYNISESLLREAYVSLGTDADGAYVSARELILRARDEGLVLSSAKQWMKYGLSIGVMRESCMESDEMLEISPELLAQFVREIEAFAHRLEVRGFAIA